MIIIIMIIINEAGGLLSTTIAVFRFYRNSNHASGK